MTIRIDCETCRQKLRVRRDKVGQRLKCPACGSVVQITQEFDEDDDPARAIAPPYGNDGRDPELYAFTDFDDSGAEDFSRLPPVRKRAKPKPASPGPPSGSAPQGESTARSSGITCTGCGKRLDAGSRYCVGCGHNNFDAAEAAFSAQTKMHERLERLTVSLRLAGMLRVLRRFF